MTLLHILKRDGFFRLMEPGQFMKHDGFYALMGLANFRPDEGHGAHQISHFL